MPATLVAVIAHLVHRLWLMMNMPKPPSWRAVEDRRPDGGRIEALTQMVQAQHEAIPIGFGVELDPAIGAATVGVPHDVAGRFGDDQLELV